MQHQNHLKRLFKWKLLVSVLDFQMSGSRITSHMCHLNHISVKHDRSGALIPNLRSTMRFGTESIETHTAEVIIENNFQSLVKYECGLGSYSYMCLRCSIVDSSF